MQIKNALDMGVFNLGETTNLLYIDGEVKELE
jgi:hypothetical protein